MRLIAFAALLLAAACVSNPPSSPPAYSDPPPVATQGFETVTVVKEFPLSVPRLRAFMEANPIINFMKPTDSIAGPAELEILEGTWPNPGAVRRVKLTDGHYVIERITKNQPEIFQYQIWVFTNAAGRGVEQIVGEQRFIATGRNTTRFEWDYRVKPTSGVTRLFVKQQLPNIEAFLAGGTDGLHDAVIAAQ